MTSNHGHWAALSCFLCGRGTIISSLPKLRIFFYFKQKPKKPKVIITITYLQRRVGNLRILQNRCVFCQMSVQSWISINVAAPPNFQAQQQIPIIGQISKDTECLQIDWRPKCDNFFSKEDANRFPKDTLTPMWDIFFQGM